MPRFVVPLQNEEGSTSMDLPEPLLVTNLNRDLKAHPGQQSQDQSKLSKKYWESHTFTGRRWSS